MRKLYVNFPKDDHYPDAPLLATPLPLLAPTAFSNFIFVSQSLDDTALSHVNQDHRGETKSPLSTDGQNYSFHMEQ